MSALMERSDQGAPAGKGSRRTMPGMDGFWVFVAGDLAMFTLMFVTFALARADDPAGFEAARLTLDADRGGINTLVLLTSSACIASALTALRRDAVGQARRWILAGVGGGAVFVVLKSLEYAAGFDAGHAPDTHEFYVYYLTLTGVHLGHVVAGCVLLLGFWVRLGRRPEGGVVGFETAAVFWHLVDFLWLLIFPLLYLAR
ncbi:cytochrome c oxidase subunit 3 [Nocardioides stalactiti]|uniref:cytochrome c oxidase subunit 3 n=1 Tax=Nocardioides stalactiti TaxID=2755356 RepID=UPI001602DE82|nr:cytochrome c oxidase subunit 3 [Nocardioides stalactiti]